MRRSLQKWLLLVRLVLPACWASAVAFAQDAPGSGPVLPLVSGTLVLTKKKQTMQTSFIFEKAICGRGQ
jgi:hypothetical protein